MNEPLAPVAEESRIDALDVVRGVALLGILLVNLQAFDFGPTAYQDPSALAPVLGEPSTADWIAYTATDTFCNMKFVTLFSLWFGLSIGLLSERARRRGHDPEPFLMLRYGILACLGLAHALGLWFGDILFIYGLTAVLLAPAARFEAHVHLLLAGAAFTAPLCLAILIGLAEMVSPGFHETDGATRLAKLELELDVFAHGSWSRILAYNMQTWIGFILPTLLLFGGRVLACFCLGVAVVKLGILTDRERRVRLARTLALTCLPLGLLCEVTRGLLELRAQPNQGEGLGLSFSAQYAGSAILAAGYAGALLLWAESGRLPVLARGFGAIGRMALTNYLSHTVICVLIFYGPGLGYFGSISRWQLPFLAVAIIGIQMVLSQRWLARFHFGPMEWLWRSVSYLRPQPLRRAAPALAEHS